MATEDLSKSPQVPLANGRPRQVSISGARVSVTDGARMFESKNAEITALDSHFKFGENWGRFLADVDEERVACLLYTSDAADE